MADAAGTPRRRGRGGGVVIASLFVATAATAAFAQTGGAQTGGAQTGGAETGGAETGGAETGGAETGGAETGGAETGGAAPSPCVILREANAAQERIQKLIAAADELRAHLEKDYAENDARIADCLAGRREQGCDDVRDEGLRDAQRDARRQIARLRRRVDDFRVQEHKLSAIAETVREKTEKTDCEG